MLHRGSARIECPSHRRACITPETRTELRQIHESGARCAYPRERTEMLATPQPALPQSELFASLRRRKQRPNIRRELLEVRSERLGGKSFSE